MTPRTQSDRQLRVLDHLQKNRMAWIAFYIVMGMFVLVFAFFVYAAFWRPDVSGWAKFAIFLLDGVLGWSVKHIVGFLFPTPPAAA
jgi:hypothetical protein